MKKLKSILFLEAIDKTVAETDLVLRQRIRLFKITTSFAIVVFAGIIYQISIALEGRLWMTGLLSFLVAAVFLNYFTLVFHKKAKTAFFVLVILLFSVLHVISYGQGGVRNSGMFYLAAIIFIAYMLLGKKGGKIMAGVSLAHVIYFYFINTYTNWADYSLIGASPGLIDLDFLITGTLSILVLTAQVNYIEQSKNAIINDIQSKQHELSFKNEALLNSQKALDLKNKELEQFVYIASHDLQEPLRTTSSFVELLHTKYKGHLDDKADIYLDYIAQSSDRMKLLINDLLNYSRIGKKNELQQLDFNIMLGEVLSDLGVALKEANAEIKADKLPVIDVYPTSIKQLFQNLITNGIKFRKKEVTPQIKIAAKQSQGYWHFSFTDNGIGIDEKHNERIFIIFQRLHTRTEYEGSGIGLAHCKKIVELHGGKIWVESKPSEGSVFHFTILKNKN